MPACLTCGLDIPAHAKFCDRCGSSKPDSATLREDRKWVVGSSPESDLVVSNDKVSALHCLLTETDGGFLLEDIHSKNGVFVDGKRIRSPFKVSRGAPVTLGLTTPMPWPEPESLGRAKVIRIGRELDNNVVLDYPTISGYHARIISAGPAAVIEDLGSRNGTALGSPERRISFSPLSRTDILYFGSFRIAASRLMSGRLSLGESPHHSLGFNSQTMTLGRDPSCDQILDYPMISRRHAQLMREDNKITVEDLGSTNGTFVNGKRITSKVSVTAGDVISLGSYSFKLTATGNLEKRDYRGNLTIEAIGVAVDVPGRRLLDDISLTVYPSELVGLMGPSGAGKTTLLMALNGYARLASGSVFINGHNLYAEYDQFRGHLGYVPQDDIMHRDLTVRQALYYTARLRLPADYTAEEINNRIEQVLSQLGLPDVADILIGSPEKKGISGGQRKRVNLAMELLADPSILFLDEPTSGLSSEDAIRVMEELNRLSKAGKIVLVTIHQPNHKLLSLMDNLVVISRDEKSPGPGRLVYYGPAYPDSAHFFNNGHPVSASSSTGEHGPSPELILRGLARLDTQAWVKLYERSKYKHLFVNARAGQHLPGTAPPIAPKIKRQIGVSQFGTLVKRCFAIKRRDKWGATILLAQAPIIALFIGMVFGQWAARDVSGAHFETFQKTAGAMRTTVFFLVIAALWFGCSNSAREIVGEWAIYHRERMINLKIPSYVLSKFAVLGSLCLIQCAMLLGIVYWWCGLKGPWILMYGVLVLTGLTGVALGLTASALVKTSEAVLALIPLILLPMIVLGGAVWPKQDITGGWTAQGIPSRWAYEAIVLMEAEEQEKYLKIPASPTPDATRQADLCEPSMEIDMADHDFPHDNILGMNKDRTGARTSVLVLTGMLVALTMSIFFILSRRDVH